VITKTIFFEEGNYPDTEYLVRAVFMASQDNYPVSEGTHNYVIDNYMTPNGFTSDKLYCHTYNATTQQVRDSFNDGRIFGIYSGHGGTYSWADGPPFSQSDVEALERRAVSLRLQLRLHHRHVHRHGVLHGDLDPATGQGRRDDLRLIGQQLLDRGRHPGEEALRRHLPE
jgi:hypothetical protein